MKTTEHGIEDSKDVENVYHMRLMALLQELVRDKGFKSAARVLELDQRTVAESAKTGAAVPAGAAGPGAGVAGGRRLGGGPVSGSATRSWRRATRRWRRGTTRWARRCAVEWPPSRAGSKPCVGMAHRGPGPVMQAPVLPRRRAVRRAWAETPRRGPGYGVSTPTS